MPDTLTFTLDGHPMEAEVGKTILEAAQAAGIWIPRLCHQEGIEPAGSCRVCTVMINGRPGSACTQPVTDGILVESETPELVDLRRTLVEMLFVEGNHSCMVCEKSGHCELQALAYGLGITAPTLPYAWPERPVDASHPDILLDHNRCILCGRCVRTSRDVDGKSVFGFAGRGANRHIAVNSEALLGDTNAEASDKALNACPVGALLRKGSAYRVPMGKRPFDRHPLGAARGGS